jgi:hypothetical protein
MATYEDQILASFEEQSMSCRQACPVSQQASPGSDEAKRMTVGSGRQCSMLLESSSPLGAFSRILLESSHWTNSQEYCYVWNRLDTRFALSAFQLTPLGQSTEGSGCSLWRTPTGTEDNGGGMNGEDRLAQGHTLRLRDQVKTLSLWPTPTAQEAKHGNPSPGETCRKNGTIISAIGKLWPTPKANDAEKRGDFNPFDPRTGLAGIFRQEDRSGSLNPHFVEELMGFPIDHTGLKP